MESTLDFNGKFRNCGKIGMLLGAILVKGLALDLSNRDYQKKREIGFRRDEMNRDRIFVLDLKYLTPLNLQDRGVRGVLINCCSSQNMHVYLDAFVSVKLDQALHSAM